MGNAEQAVIGGSGRRETRAAEFLCKDILVKSQEERGCFHTPGIHGSV